MSTSSGASLCAFLTQSLLGGGGYGQSAYASSSSAYEPGGAEVLTGLGARSQAHKAAETRNPALGWNPKGART
jgi:hypothetical protein